MTPALNLADKDFVVAYPFVLYLSPKSVEWELFILRIHTVLVQILCSSQAFSKLQLGH